MEKQSVKRDGKDGKSESADTRKWTEVVRAGCKSCSAQEAFVEAGDFTAEEAEREAVAALQARLTEHLQRVELLLLIDAVAVLADAADRRRRRVTLHGARAGQGRDAFLFLEELGLERVQGGDEGQVGLDEDVEAPRPRQEVRAREVEAHLAHQVGDHDARAPADADFAVDEDLAALLPRGTNKLERLIDARTDRVDPVVGDVLHVEDLDRAVALLFPQRVGRQRGRRRTER